MSQLIQHQELDDKSPDTKRALKLTLCIFDVDLELVLNNTDREQKLPTTNTNREDEHEKKDIIKSEQNIQQLAKAIFHDFVNRQHKGF